MRRVLFPIVTLLVLLLWLEPLTSCKQQATPEHRPEMALVAPTTRSLTGPPTSRPGRLRPATMLTSPSASAPTTAVATQPASIATTQPHPTAKPIAYSRAPIPPRPKPPAEPGPMASYEWAKLSGKEGFWRIGQTVGGVWWFISPENTLQFMNSVTTVQPYQLAKDPKGTIYLSRDYDGTPTKPGDLKKWAQRTLQRVHEAGFKGLGAWCHPVFHEMPVPVTRDLLIWASAPAEAPRLYDPGWLPAAETLIRKATEPLKDNPNLIGYYLDNEINFSDVLVGPGVYFDNLPPDNPNRKQVVAVIHRLWPEIEQFNLAWGLSLRNYAELDSLKVLPKDPPDTRSYLSSVWLEHLMRDYFQQTTALVRKYDPNHMVLGIRYAGYALPEVIRASKGFCDAQSINYYVSDALLDPELFHSLYDIAQVPVIISEYSFHSLDGRSGNRNNSGFPAQVMDQRARADAYRLFTSRLARTPWIIGADWFQWFDEPPSGRSADGEDANFGYVDVDDRAYPLLADAIRDTSKLTNSQHATSFGDDGKGVWREDFAVRPIQHVPYLTTPIILNGELSDWPESARLQPMHLTQTVGLERSVAPAPRIYLGWRPEGLYLGMEVYDSDPVAAPITGHWWTRDVAEFWVSTRPVASGQTSYNQYSHEFMFLPTDGLQNSNGVTGSVGQWHRPGDALNDHLLPHPEIQYNCRILMDRYVVELFIPANSLHGWDPVKFPQIAFNVNVRNYQHALAYFWSAPKELQTQLRPKTWGILVLDPAANTANAIDDHDSNARNVMSVR